MTVTEPAIAAYVEAHTTGEGTVLAGMATATRDQTESAGMMVGHLEGRLLEMLVWLHRPRLVVEIGTFTGYSAVAMASALEPGARLVTCELDPVHADLARRHIAASGLGDRIELREGPALETLAGMGGVVDLAFVDADKTGYGAYYEALMERLAPRGLIVVDNVLWHGLVLDPPAGDADAQALAEFNDMVHADERVVNVMLPVRDGVTLIRRRPDPGPTP